MHAYIIYMIDGSGKFEEWPVQGTTDRYKIFNTVQV